MYPKFIAAAVQAAPVYMNARQTAQKASVLIHKAASQGARLVAFPEVFIPGYPYWNWIMSPLEGSPWFERLYNAAIDIDGEEIDLVRRAAAETQTTVLIGVNERSSISMGTIYNTNLLIGPDGKICGRHRKIMPTFAEKLTWGSGDGASIRVHETDVGRVGSLACGENTNTLARYALLAQGEQVHIANYIAFPFTTNYDMIEAIKIRAGAHSFEGKVFSIVACSIMSEEIKDLLGANEERRALLSGSPNAFSGIFGPDGQLLCPPLIDEEGIVVAEIDLQKCVAPKQFHDIIGHYNRFDIFRLRLNRTGQTPIHCEGEEEFSDLMNISEPVVDQ